MTASEFSAEEIIDIAGGRLAQGLMPEGAGQISTDTRTLGHGQWYLALSGEKFDGHHFLGDAFSAGARGAIVNQRQSYPIAGSSFPLIAVADTLKAYQGLARAWRRKVKPIVVAVTGSSGKTTTKEMCAAVFSAGLRTYKSAANENNEIGVPKTILSMPADTQVLVIEMAMRAEGEIALSADIALPDIGIIVNAGLAHLGVMSSLDNIVAAKCELAGKLAGGGLAIIGDPTELLMEGVKKVFKGKTLACLPGCFKEVSVTSEQTDFEMSSSDGATSRFVVNAHGLAQLQDAWCAIMAGRRLNLDDAVIARGLAAYRPLSGRGRRLGTASGAIVVDEAYNANPDSVRSSVSAFVDSRAFPQKHKYVVLGELAELGHQSIKLHRELGLWLACQKLSGLIVVGPVARHIAEGAQAAGFEVIACRDQKEAENLLKLKLTADSCVLIKGSHCANLEHLVSALVA